MKVSTELIINGDAVAMANMCRLNVYCRKRNISLHNLSDSIGVSDKELIEHLFSGKPVPVWKYNKIALELNWPEYVSGRKYGALDKPCVKVSENDAADIEMMRANLRGLRKQREARGLTLRQVVELGYTRSASSLGNLERGVKSFSPEEYNSLAKIFGWELVEEKPLMIFPESMIPIKPDPDCECIPYSGVSVIQTAKDDETRNIWNDDVAIDHMIALREDDTVSKKELAKELGLETGRLEYFLKQPHRTKVGLFNRIAGKFGWELYQERRSPIKLSTIAGDSVAEENIKNLEKTRLSQNITLEELSTKTRLSAKNYLKPVEKGEIPCSILAYNRIRKVFGWEQYPSRKFMRERKLKRTFGKNYKPAK